MNKFGIVLHVLVACVFIAGPIYFSQVYEQRREALVVSESYGMCMYDADYTRGRGWDFSYTPCKRTMVGGVTTAAEAVPLSIVCEETADDEHPQQCGTE